MELCADSLCGAYSLSLHVIPKQLEIITDGHKSRSDHKSSSGSSPLYSVVYYEDKQKQHYNEIVSRPENSLSFSVFFLLLLSFSNNCNLICRCLWMVVAMFASDKSILLVKKRIHFYLSVFRSFAHGRRNIQIELLIEHFVSALLN